MLSQLLHKDIPSPAEKGRVVRFFKDDNFKVTVGSIEDRVMTLLSELDRPASMCEISRGVGSTKEKVAPRINNLLKVGVIDTINDSGFSPEYFLKKAHLGW